METELDEGNQLKTERVLGTYGNPDATNVLICIGGIHGNEPAAIYAIQTVLNELCAHSRPFSGFMIGLAGNLAALSGGARYVDEDLNRIWTDERVYENGKTPDEWTRERQEQSALHKYLIPFIKSTTKNVVLIDLHTTSAPSVPFSIVADSLRNREVALHLPVPMILGLEEHLEGTIGNYYDDQGMRTLAFESGKHDDPASVENHIAAIWLLLAASGCINIKDYPQLAEHRSTLRSCANGLNRVFETRYRHDVSNTPGFRMAPGYKNFQKISESEELASVGDEAVKSPHSGNIFMPLYQSQGSDGFFIIRPVRFFWLQLAKWLRYMRLEQLLVRLPGIRRSRISDHAVVVNQKIARWYVIEIFHLLGYRKKLNSEGNLVLIKRKYDIKGPE